MELNASSKTYDVLLSEIDDPILCLSTCRQLLPLVISVSQHDSGKPTSQPLGIMQPVTECETLRRTLLYFTSILKFALIFTAVICLTKILFNRSEIMCLGTTLAAKDIGGEQILYEKDKEIVPVATA